MIIVGAGLSGLIAGHYFRSEQAQLIEASPGLPNNHEALLRFRSNIVSTTTRIPFKKYLVRKAIMYQGSFADQANVYLANMYSAKVTGAVQERSIWNLDPVERWVAPPDFTKSAESSLAVGVQYGHTMSWHDFVVNSTKSPVISTIPMPIMMDLYGWKYKPEFKSSQIWSYQVDIIDPPIDVAQTIYYPDIEVAHYRASITGNKLIIELSRLEDYGFDQISEILADFGIFNATLSIGERKLHQYGKILPIDDALRRDFIYTLTRDYNIYSLGRFAIWKQILLDDVAQDCDAIGKMIRLASRRDLYRQHLRESGRAN